MRILLIIFGLSFIQSCSNPLVPPAFLEVCSESHEEGYYVPGPPVIIGNIIIPTTGALRKKSVCDKMIVVENPAYKEYLNGR